MEKGFLLKLQSLNNFSLHSSGSKEANKILFSQFLSSMMVFEGIQEKWEACINP